MTVKTLSFFMPKVGKITFCKLDLVSDSHAISKESLSNLSINLKVVLIFQNFCLDTTFILVTS